MIKSPVTLSENTRVLKEIRTEVIKNFYSNLHHIDVSPYFKGLDSIQLVECMDTTLKFFYPGTTAGDGAFYNALYKPYSEQPKEEIDYWKKEFQIAYDLISPTDSVLEVGCGYGTFLEKASKKAATAQAVELNPAAVEVCLQRGLKVEKKMIQDLAQEGKKFDFVCCFQVLEHITDIHSFLKSMIEVLKPGGTLVIAVPNNEPFHLGYFFYSPLNMPPHHMSLWNEKSFKKLPNHFPITHISTEYESGGRTIVEAFYYAHLLAGIKKIKKDLSAFDYLKILFFIPYTSTYCFLKKIRKQPHHGSIIVHFKKLNS